MHPSPPAPEISLVVETYNLAEGQSARALERALTTVQQLVEQRTDCEALLVDGTPDPRPVERLLARFAHVRHERCPGADYDELKTAGAVAATGRIVVYLDGDCVPDDSGWLDALVGPIRRGEASATCGTTLYEGSGLLRALTTVMDFSFVTAARGGPVGCYPGNNAAFVRELRATVCPPEGPMRCRCYAHAQHLLRSGNPVLHVEDALVWHESPPLFRERFRRGYDLVAACWVDPLLPQARWLRWSVLAAPLFYGWALRWDWRTLDAGHPRLALSGWRRPAAKALAPLLRLLDLAGMARALALGPARPLAS